MSLITPGRALGALAAVGIGGAIGYAAGAAKNDPAEPENNLTDIAGPAGLVLAFAGTLGAVTGEFPRFGATVAAAGGVAMLAGTIVGEVRDGQPY